MGSKNDIFIEKREIKRNQTSSLFQLAPSPAPGSQQEFHRNSQGQAKTSRFGLGHVKGKNSPSPGDPKQLEFLAWLKVWSTMDHLQNFV